MIDVYLREQPRAFILVSSSSTAAQAGGTDRNRTALVLSAHVKGSRAADSSSFTRALIETVSTTDIPELVSLRKTHVNVFGCLGLINVGSDLFVGIVEKAVSVGAIQPEEEVLRISSVIFHCLNADSWDNVLQNGFPNVQGAVDPAQRSLQYQGQYEGAQHYQTEHPCLSLRKLLANGTFYFAKDASFDISRRLDRRSGVHATSVSQNSRLISPVMENPPTLPTDARQEQEQDVHATYDPRFIWNTYMMEPLQEYRTRLDPQEMQLFDQSKFLLYVMQGYVGSSQLGASSTIALISRLSWKRAGTRFAVRGIDDDGNVANFAESETMYTYEGRTMSYLQVRGSVPLFWEQQGLQTFNARIQITRSRAASQPAFDRHFVDLLTHYSHIQALNLLGTRDAETVLTQSYAEHMRNSEAEELFLATLSKEDGSLEEGGKGNLDRIGLTNFDFHSTTRTSGGLDGAKAELMRLAPVQRKKEAFAYSIVNRDRTFAVRQRGVFRVNCLDCLDRTNVVQDILSQEALHLCVNQDDDGGLPDVGAALWAQHRILWAENGDALSKIYAGTGALNSNFTRTGVGKKTLGGLLSDAAKSASRLYINNFQDKSKQNVIDALLGNMANQRPVSIFDPVHDAVNAELERRMDEFSSPKQVTVFCGTWNLAGRGPSGENLEAFLFPHTASVETDILAIGLQEVVPLTPQQILLTDPEKLRFWERTISNAIANRSNREKSSTRYIQLRSEQLVGTALILFIKEALLPFVRQVEAGTKKTGLKGMSGNKGGVAIRMNIYDTSFCFVTAHFAAGKSNVEERNADFMTISRELNFNSGRNVDNGHHVFWLGDFNYRIEGSNELVRPLCDRGDLDELMRNDQLIRAKNARQAFHGYTEGLLVFLPTYKYDFHSQRYDTGEKMRVPAWTDRILYKNRSPFIADLIVYDRAELLTSDHRPVFAIFQADARQFDTAKRNALRRELLAKYKTIQAGRGTHSDLLGESLFTSEDEGNSTPIDDEDDEGYTTEDLPQPSSADVKVCWWDEPLTSEEEINRSSEGEDSTSESSKEERRINLNPFRRQNYRQHQPAVQYAQRRPLTNSTRSGPASSSSNRGPSPLPLHSSPSPIVVKSSVDAAKSLSQPATTARRAPPKPPSNAKEWESALQSPQRSDPAREKPSPSLEITSAPPSSSPAFATAQQSKTYENMAKVPPTVPTKPREFAKRTSSDDAEASKDDHTHSATLSTKLPADKFPPLIPARPGLGPRAQSYQSTKSQRSLLDDSE